MYIGVIFWVIMIVWLIFGFTIPSVTTTNVTQVLSK